MTAMARIWVEQEYISVAHEYWDEITENAWKGTLMVHVAAFTFSFRSLRQLRECLAFYERKVLPSGILPMPKAADGFTHWHAQRWFERLPMHLREEPKRQRVIKALTRAIEFVEAGKFSPKSPKKRSKKTVRSR